VQLKSKYTLYIIPPLSSGVITYIFFIFYLFFINTEKPFVDVAINIVKLAPTFIALFTIAWAIVFFSFGYLFTKISKAYLWSDKDIYFWVSLLSLILGGLVGVINFMMEADFFKAFVIFASIVFGSVFSASIYFEMKKNG